MVEEGFISVPRKKLCIIGGGRFGRNLARVAHDCGEYDVHMGSKSLEQSDMQTECPNVTLHKDYEEAMEGARIVILAVPPKLMKAIVATNLAVLAGTIIVEVSNPNEFKHDREYQDTLMHDMDHDFPNLCFVKCLNTISSESLQSYQYPIGFMGEAFVCGDNEGANQEVKDFVNDIGIPCRVLGRAEKTKFVENFQAQFFHEWRLSFWVLLGLLLFFIAYNMVWSGLSSLENWARFTLFFRTVFGAVGINLIAVTYLPGTIAQFLVYRKLGERKPVILPRWLFNWMSIRIKLGILSLAFIIMHSILELYSSDYVMFVTKIYVEISIFFAVIGLACGTILAILTLPGMSPLISYREWIFYQRYIGWSYLVFGVVHVCCYWGPDWNKSTSFLWFGGVPPTSLISVIIPFLVIFMKICVLIFVGFKKLTVKRKREYKPRSDTSGVSSTQSIRSWWSNGSYSDEK